MSGATETASNSTPEKQQAASYLVRSFSSERPLDRPSRHRLRSGEEVLVHRGDARSATRNDSPKKLTLEEDDARMSSAHVRIREEAGRWQVEDLGSKNGTFLNGVKFQKTVLTDGDVIEAGRTWFVFRRGPALEPDDLDARDGDPGPLATLSPVLGAAFARVAAAAKSTIPVLILGETGTGKEIVARAFHDLSRRPGEFIAVNCAAIPDALIESELFGYKKGAFSGATEDRPGLVRAADKGTLFLDEVAELSPRAQASLLRTLQEREVRPLGGTSQVKVDLRVLAATHGNLDDAVANEKFREDLLARLDGVRVPLPPLRERREDLGLLAQSLLLRLAPKREIRFSHRSARDLFARAWERNVRELERAIEAALSLSGDVLELPAAPGSVPPPPPAPSDAEDDGTKHERREELRALLREHGGNVAAVARAMGKAREQVYRWIKSAGLDPDEFRSD